MYTTAAEFRAQLIELETSAIHNCIAHLAHRSSSLTPAGIAFNCRHLDALTNQQLAQIAEGVLAERENQAEEMLAAAEPVGSVACVEAAMAQAAAQPVAQPKARARCPHYHLIRELFVVAREKGLDTSDAARDRMRGAMGMLLGKRIESRSQMTACDWAFCTDAVRLGRLFW